MVSSWRIAGSILVTLSLLALAPAALASTTRLGAAPKLPSGTRTLGPVAASTTIPVTIVLQPRDPLGLQQYATDVSTPGSSIYRQYLTVSEFAQRFGPTPAAIQSVLASLRAHGLAPGKPTTNGMTIPVRASAAALTSAFSISLEQVALPSGGTAIVNSAPPALDAGVVPHVQAVIGLDTLTVAHPGAVAGPPRTAAKPRIATGGPQPCSAAVGHGNTADQIATAYGMAGFYGAGDLGAGQTIAIFQLEPTPASDIAAYQACYGTHTAYGFVSVDGGPRGSASGESSLDLEDVIGLAPRAHVLVYQGCQGTPCPSGLVDTYNRIVSDNVAKVVSSSWGLCEPNGSTALFNAENTIFQEAAVQGQSVFAASGDRGSEDCFGKPPGPQTALTVEDPASQPFVTGVGGTHLSALGPPPTESVWNEYQYPPTLGKATGGGLSSHWSMPSYQANAPRSLNVINGNSSGTPCAKSGGLCREVPDVSADGDPNTGYAIYFSGGWHSIGGTSASTPTLAAITALTNASAACAGSPIGFANGVLYSAAARAYSSVFNDVTSGNNDSLGLNGGLYPAGPGYDMASGLGTPNGLNLAAVACNSRPQAAFKVTNTRSPGTGQPVQFDGTLSRETGGSIRTYAWTFGDGGTATGAKPRHTYRKKGRYTVTLTVTDPRGQTASQRGTLYVGRGGKITNVKVDGHTITVKVNGPGNLKVGKHVQRIKKAKGREVSFTVGKAGDYNVQFAPKYGDLQTKRAKVK